jgi:pimeloyl-ACP methyl ester carboxylesterase
MRPRTLLVLPCLAFALTACVSGPALLDETRTEPHAGYLRRGAALATRSAFVRAEDPGAAPLVVHLTEVHAPGGGDGPLFVLVPGLLADHKTFRFLWPLLGERHDLLLVDPPGTGRSDKPSLAALPPGGYSPAWLGRHALRAVRAWQCRGGDKRPLVFVAHSLGSVALVRALAEPATAAEMPDVVARVDALALLAMPDVGMTEVADVFREVADLKGPVVAAGRVLGILDAQVREGVRASTAAPERRAFCQEADRLAALIADDASRCAAQAMLRRFRPTRPDGRLDWPRIRAQQASHRSVRVPILLLWGRQDETLPPAMAHDVQDQLPTARLVWVEDSKHSPHQEQPRFVADRVLQFVEPGE